MNNTLFLEPSKVMLYGEFREFLISCECLLTFDIWQVCETVGRFSRTACNHAYPQKAIGFLEARKGAKWSWNMRRSGGGRGVSKKRQVWHPFSLIALPFRTGCVVAIPLVPLHSLASGVTHSLTHSNNHIVKYSPKKEKKLKHNQKLSF